MKSVLQWPVATAKRRVVTGILTVVLAASVGFAAWSIITASGSSSAKIGSLVAPTINAGSVSGSGDIYPSPTLTATGGLRMSVVNPNNSALVLQSLSVDATNVAGGTSGCDLSVRTRATGVADEFGWAGQGSWYVDPGSGTNLTLGAVSKTFSGLSIAVPAAATTEVVVPLAIFAAGSIPTVCQGQAIANLAVTNATFSTS